MNCNDAKIHFNLSLLTVTSLLTVFTSIDGHTDFPFCGRHCESIYLQVREVGRRVVESIQFVRVSQWAWSPRLSAEAQPNGRLKSPGGYRDQNFCCVRNAKNWGSPTSFQRNSVWKTILILGLIKELDWT